VVSRKIKIESVDKVFDRVEEEFRPGWQNQFPSTGDILKLSKVICNVCNGTGEIISKTGYECICPKCKGKKEIIL